jgi:hypothetical protein
VNVEKSFTEIRSMIDTSLNNVLKAVNTELVTLHWNIVTLDTYAENKIMTPLVTQISWTHHLIILSKSKTEIEREFYLEVLDRDVKKPHENPSIGVLLCKDKDDEVVEYALSRSLSPTLVAQYQSQLPTRSSCKTNSTNYWKGVWNHDRQN